jgi:hypothetical protein
VEEDVKKYFPLLKRVSMVFNATFNNILDISWWSILLVEESGNTRKKLRPVVSH